MGAGSSSSKRSVLAYLALAGASLLFGGTFVIVKEAIRTLPPFSFVGWRFLIGAVILLVPAWPRLRVTWRDGFVAGFVLFVGYAFQTVGLVHTSASNSGLITGLYVVLTPLVAAVWWRRPPGRWVVVGAAVAFVGLFLLTSQGRLEIPGRGDLLTIGCAAAFAVHIVVLARCAPRNPVLPFTGVQLLTVAVLSLLSSVVWEGAPLPHREVLVALLVTGVGVSAGAFMLQVWAQTVVGPARTAVLLALEPAFAAFFAAVFLDERLSARGLVGGVLILIAIYLVIIVADQSEDLPAAEAISEAH